MSEHINTYEACREHMNGHANHCEKCETEAVRGILRSIATSLVTDSEGPCGIFAGTIAVHIPREVWETILPLRTPSAVMVNGDG